VIKIIISGCNGKMGQVLTKLIEKENDMEVVAGLDPYIDVPEQAFPIFSSPSSCDIEADVLIDFSHHSALPSILDFALSGRCL